MVDGNAFEEAVGKELRAMGCDATSNTVWDKERKTDFRVTRIGPHDLPVIAEIQLTVTRDFLVKMEEFEKIRRRIGHGTMSLYVEAPNTRHPKRVARTIQEHILALSQNNTESLWWMRLHSNGTTIESMLHERIGVIKERLERIKREGGRVTGAITSFSGESTFLIRTKERQYAALFTDVVERKLFHRLNWYKRYGKDPFGLGVICTPTEEGTPPRALVIEPTPRTKKIPRAAYHR